jgi:plasmid maintenance system antidote protein VapI
MAKKSKHVKVSDQLRRIIDASDVNRRVISQATHIAESTLSEFMAGRRGLSMKALDRLGEYLGLEIVVTKPPQRGK